ncbi:UNVERIFIED_CONTAM: hypothetical protein GTU68_004501 [Idotea baltica]|nr:hypothetical protein [Idotea baltica]
MTKVGIQLILSGHVQGVGFRYAAQQKAATLNLAGWVKNKANGDVEIFANGEQYQLGVFIDWAKSGPQQADIDRIVIKTKNTPNEALADFTIR